MSRLANWLYDHFSFTLIRHSVLQDYQRVQKIRQVIRHCEIDLVLDVGANRGQYVSMLRRRVGYRGKVISFEPVSSIHEHLLRKLGGDRNWSLQTCALGSEETEQPINVMELDVFSSFLTPAGELPDRFRIENKVQRTETVPVRTLTSFFERGLIPADKNIFLKMDTQGFDFEVMKGASEYLHRIRAVQTELSFHELYRNMPSWQEVTSFLYGAGFILAGLYEVCSENTRLLEADGIFVRR